MCHQLRPCKGWFTTFLVGLDIFLLGGGAPVVYVRWAASATDVLKLHRRCVMEMSHICDGWSVNPHKSKRVCCHFVSFFFSLLTPQNPITHAVAQVNNLSSRRPPLELYIIGHVFGWRVPHTRTRSSHPKCFIYLSAIPNSICRALP